MLLSRKPFVAATRPSAVVRRPTVAVQAKLSLSGLVAEVGRAQLKKEVPPVQVGDNVKIGLAVVEGNGKTRTQKLDGVLIAEHGAGTSKTITFRRVFQGVGVELVLPLHSPALQTVELVRRGRVRRSKLYYLRDRMGKSARLKEVLGTKSAEAVNARNAAEKKAALAAAQAQ